MKTNYTNQIIARGIDVLCEELSIMWAKASMVDRQEMSFIDNLSDVSYTVFARIYKHIESSWSKSAIAGELTKGNKQKVLNAIKN